MYEPLEEHLSSGESDDFDNGTGRTSHIFTRAIPEPLSNRSLYSDINTNVALETEQYGAMIPFGKSCNNFYEKRIYLFCVISY